MLNKEILREKIDFILNRLLICFFFAVLIIYTSREITDLDMWLHLKTGEVIVKNKAVPLFDIFSYTLASKPWINHEWLFQTISYLFYSFGQWDGLIFMQNIVFVSIFILLLFIGLKEKNHIYVFIVLYLTLLATAYRFTIRPDIFSLFFLTLYLFIIKKFIENKSKSILLLPICQLLWVNMHGFFFTGPLLIIIFLIGEIIKRTVRLPYSWNETKRLDDNQMLTLVIVLGTLILASLFNPHGLNGAAYPFAVLGQISGKGKVVFEYIQELAKPMTFNNIFQLSFFTFYKAFILISLFGFRFNQKHLNISDIILWLLFFLFSLIAIRNVAYFIILAAYTIFANVELALKNKKEIPFKFPNKTAKVIATYLLMGFLFYYPGKGAMQYIESANYNFDTYKLKSMLWGLSEVRYPDKGVDFLLSHEFPAHMYNDFNSGAYLIGHAYPKRQVFIDGRTELYGPDFFMDYVAIGEGNKDVLEKILKRYDIEGFFLSNSTTDLHSGLLKFLFQDPRWKAVYFDEGALIFLKDTRNNAALINKYNIDLRKWSPPKPDFLKLGIAARNPMPYIQRGSLLNMLGCFEAAAKEAKIALDIMPHNAEALKYMADYYFDKKDYLEAYKYTRNCLIYTQGHVQMRTRLALIYHYLNEDEKALKVIDSIIKNNRKYAEGYYVKALIIKEKNKKEAKKLFYEAIKLSSKEPKYHIALGDLLMKEGNAVSAKKEWMAAFQYDSANGSLKRKLGKIS